MLLLKIKRLLAVGYLSLNLLFLSGCSKEKIPDGRILFRNDSRDREYNQIVVSGTTLSPGQSSLLPHGTTRFSVSRRYKDHTKSYTVECPTITGAGISIRLIDVHVNRIAGGCKTVDAQN